MSMQTGVVPYNSELRRKDWIREGLVQAASTSYWSQFTGTSPESVIYQKNDLNASNGMNVVFDYDGFLTGEGFRGFEQAFGKGETKRKFSDKLTIEFGRYAVDNGNKFNASEIDALNLTNHADSRSKLADLWIRNKDQAIFDTLSGALRGEVPTHILRPNKRANISDLTNTDVLSYDYLINLETILKTGKGYTVGGSRIPLMPINGSFLFFVDSFQAASLKLDPKFQTLMSNADTRGANNAIISGQVGTGPATHLATIGTLKIYEMPTFYGKSTSNKLFKTSVEISGARTMDDAGNFSGTETFDGTAFASRGFVLGKSAVQLAFGMQPDYKFKSSQDFDITSQSAVEIWYNVQKTVLLAEHEDYEEAKVAGHTFGVIAVDTKIVV